MSEQAWQADEGNVVANGSAARARTKERIAPGKISASSKAFPPTGGSKSGRHILAELTGAGDVSPSHKPLPTNIKNDFQNSLGVELDGVNLAINQSGVDDIGAKAVTQGTDIHFGVGQYQPNIPTGRALLRHELAHVGQNLMPHGVAGTQDERESEASAFADGSIDTVHYAGTSEPQFDIKADLRDAMSGWGTDEDAIYSRLRRAKPDELEAVLDDVALMKELQKELNKKELKRVLNLLDAPLSHKLRLAMKGWGTDEQYIFSSLKAAEPKELQYVVNDRKLMSRLGSELSRKDMRKVLRLLDAPVKVRLRMAVQGWGTDEELIFETLSSATNAELKSILSDRALMESLRGDLGRGDMRRALDLLDAPLAEKLTFAMDGWGTDEDYIFNSIAAASDAERTDVGADAALMRRLRDELSRELFLRAITELGVALPLEQRLNLAMDGWGVASTYLFQQIALASDAEKIDILNNPGLMKRLKSELSGREYLALLRGVNAPIDVRLHAACDGWGTDERYIYDTIVAASDADRQSVMANAGLMKRLEGELTHAETRRLLTTLDAPLADKLKFALDGWETDMNYIRESLALATPAEKSSVRSDKDLMERLHDELSAKELRVAFGSTPEIEADRCFKNRDYLAALNLLTNNSTGTATALTAFEALGNSVERLLGCLPRGQDCPNDARQDLTTLIENDNITSRVGKAFDVRWNVESRTRSKKVDTDGDGKEDTEVTPSWSVARYRQIHRVLLALPDSHVLSGLIDDIVIYGDTSDSGGVWRNRGWLRDNEIELGDGAFSGTETFTNVSSTTPDRNVDWLDAMMRHEVGHSVDDMLGSRTDGIKVGLGGWWSGTDISQWIDGIPNPFTTSGGDIIPDDERKQIKDHICDYLQTDCTKPLFADTPAGHPIRTYWSDNVPIIEAARHTEGQGDRFWKDPTKIKQYGASYYTLGPKKKKFQRFNTDVFDNRVRDYAIYTANEFFAELYTVYYETGHTPGSSPGQHMPVASWKDWFDRNVHAAGRSPDAVVGNSAKNQ